MRFEVVNEKGQVVMTTTSMECIPSKDILDSMSKLGYKFHLNGKVASKKKIIETVK